MPIVEIPEILLLKSGIPQRYMHMSLRMLKKYHDQQQAYKLCCRYTRSLKQAVKRGIGLCIFGDDTVFRKQAFYGVVKAAIAQGVSVQCVDIEDLVTAHKGEPEQYRKFFSVDILAFPEMELPDTVVNDYIRSITFKVFKKRSEAGKPIIVCTALEVLHPSHSLDLVYKGIGHFIVTDTILVNMAPDRQCEWVRKGHQATLAGLASVKVK